MTNGLQKKHNRLSQEIVTIDWCSTNHNVMDKASAVHMMQHAKLTVTICTKYELLVLLHRTNRGFKTFSSIHVLQLQKIKEIARNQTNCTPNS